MKTTQSILIGIILLGFAGSARAEGMVAKADLKNSQGESIGTVEFYPKDDKVELVIEAKGLTAGKHGIHIHENGLCEAPEFKSAGPHFNPEHKKHGLENAEGCHAGDLPNLEVGEDGTVKTTLFSPGFKIEGEKSILKEGGTAVVIHAGPDDEKTDPAGNSGTRIACGVIKKV
jgi:Cu-Zn family superoxide dismutase